MPRAMQIHVGRTPPTSIDHLWLDTSVAGSRIDPAAGSRRTPFAVPTVPYCTGYSAEPSMHYVGGADPHWSMVYFVAPGVIAYAQCRDPGSDDPYAWVHAPSQITPGVTYGSHQGVHLYNGVLHYVGALASGATTMRLWTAPVPAFGQAPVWTDRGDMTGVSFASGTNGNPGLCWLPDGTVLLFLETLQSGQWRMGVYTASSVLGPWTLLQGRIEELAPASGFGYCGPWPVVENDGLTMLYHSSMGISSVGHKARSKFAGFKNLANWLRLSDMASPWISRVHEAERDQVADLCCAQNEDGFGWAAWSGNNNASNKQSVIIAPLIPTLKAYVGGSWVAVDVGHNPHFLRDWVETETVSNADASIESGQVKRWINLGADRVCTLPRAAEGSRCRIVVGNNSGTFGVTPAVASGSNVVTGLADTIEASAATKVMPYQTRTLVCYSNGVWQLEAGAVEPGAWPVYTGVSASVSLTLATLRGVSITASASYTQGAPVLTGIDPGRTFTVVWGASASATITRDPAFKKIAAGALATADALTLTAGQKVVETYRWDGANLVLVSTTGPYA